MWINDAFITAKVLPTPNKSVPYPAHQKGREKRGAIKRHPLRVQTAVQKVTILQGLALPVQ